MRHEGKRTCLTRTARSERKNIPPETLETRNIKKLHGTHSRTHPPGSVEPGGVTRQHRLRHVPAQRCPLYKGWRFRVSRVSPAQKCRVTCKNTRDRWILERVSGPSEDPASLQVTARIGVRHHSCLTRHCSAAERPPRPLRRRLRARRRISSRNDPHTTLHHLSTWVILVTR